jgi:cobalt-zinc-cadmium efflux system protein
MGKFHGGPERRTRTSRKLLIATIATVLFFGIELAAGLISNSLALIGDAFHNITDAFALVLALVAVSIARRPATVRKSFGYRKAGILAAFLNATILIALMVIVMIEAIRRVRQPEPVEGAWMIGVALIGIVYNFGVTIWLMKEGRKDINVRGAMLHMFGDGLSSVGVVIAALLILWTGTTIWDPLVSILIGLVVFWTSWGILKEAVNLLLEGTPKGIDPERVTVDLAADPEVLDVHHLHIWALGPASPALSCHLMMGDVTLRSAGEVLDRVNAMLAERYGIQHTTIQIEAAACAEDDPDCIPCEATVHGL